ncbi:MAG: type II toxin-antitoxin system Phd/YefM family antitoxin [Cyanobacteria bacterium P01_F01_bin.53]
MSESPNEWQLQEAKNKLSQVVKAADSGQAQYITVRGKQAAVVLSAADYKKLVQPDESLSSALLMPVLEEDDVSLFERSQDTGREINL